ncbi:hypothetical protein [Henriciella marina]|uniref:Alkaline proteinase inhibitor/ Outer membrane lipoprotein Omp19 domain-containing protein n=1 Tax=Henriciella marina TaxID=453851 RepID=A0ABT4LVJ0_9PROT|nr:hypothetical protein [Henriciella marina]MCZ4298389.1 hypothetical protein [Henriciella marina]
MLSRLRLACLTVSLLALGPNATAQAAAESDPGDVLGNWTFQTKPYRDGQCIMSGTARLTPHPDEGVYNCELTAVEVCSMWGRSVVVQSCKARRFNEQVSIRSEIEQFVESKAEGLVYVPDNFALTVQDGRRMYGSLVSAATAPVEFIRAEEGIS